MTAAARQGHRDERAEHRLAAFLDAPPDRRFLPGGQQTDATDLGEVLPDAVVVLRPVFTGLDAVVELRGHLGHRHACSSFS